MGAILHSVEQNSQVLSVAVIDKNGNVLQTMDFYHLQQPRSKKNQQDEDIQKKMN